jgi:hypothetical protein
MNRRGARSAFTLLEVTLATAIFAGAIVVLTSSFANALAALRTMRTDAGDEPVLRYVSALAMTIPDRQNFIDGEELDAPGQSKVTWKATVEDTPVADLFKVELTITLTKPDVDEPVVRVEKLYLLRPTWSDTDDRAKIISEAKTALTTSRGTIQ